MNSVNGMLKVEAFSPEVLAHLTKLGATAPNQCYANIMKIVLDAQGAKYVLCKVQDDAGNWHGHAIVKSENGIYGDPTLQKNLTINRQYKLFREYDLNELRQLLSENGQVVDGILNGYPPALTTDEKVVFVYVAGI